MRRPAPAVNSATLIKGIVMFSNEFSNIITLTKIRNDESIEIDSRNVHIRQNQNGLMALSYVAPIFDIMDLEKFFDDLISSEMLALDIGGTGKSRVSYRGLVDGKGKNFPQNMDHRIILLQKPKFNDDRENVQITGFSKFKPRGRIS
ncbi:hypothetical protein [uncultured Methanobrevibacter sp.]|uniref:hypothetical protein n=1 Tax=uncultured Methanobrevibacter sp. TaxID=253161 RepID=UPI0025F5542C|nr:hypothetical protein [uncultured Methanobrevibacter sp.]